MLLLSMNTDPVSPPSKRRLRRHPVIVSDETHRLLKGEVDQRNNGQGGGYTRWTMGNVVDELVQERFAGGHNKKRLSRVK